MSTTSCRAALWVALLTLLQPLPVWAYIDPNAGGMLLQLLAPLFAAIIGGWLFLRRWIVEWARRLWRRITGRAGE